jgi:hypothetical protein
VYELIHTELAIVYTTKVLHSSAQCTKDMVRIQNTTNTPVCIIESKEYIPMPIWFHTVALSWAEFCMVYTAGVSFYMYLHHFVAWKTIFVATFGVGMFIVTCALHNVPNNCVYTCVLKELSEESRNPFGPTCIVNLQHYTQTAERGLLWLKGAIFGIPLKTRRKKRLS